MQGHVKWTGHFHNGETNLINIPANAVQET